MLYSLKFLQLPGNFDMIATFDLFLKLHFVFGLNFEPNIAPMANFCCYCMYKISVPGFKPTVRMKELDSFLNQIEEQKIWKIIYKPISHLRFGMSASLESFDRVISLYHIFLHSFEVFLSIFAILVRIDRKILFAVIEQRLRQLRYDVEFPFNLLWKQ